MSYNPKTTGFLNDTKKPKKASPAKKARKMPAAVKTELAVKRKTKPRSTVRPRLPFVPGSLNDQISKLGTNDSLARCLRIPLASSNEEFVQINDETQKFFKAQNSILSGGIAKVRVLAEHKGKKFKMERGTYMSASNDAMFAFLTITRTE